MQSRTITHTLAAWAAICFANVLAVPKLNAQQPIAPKWEYCRFECIHTAAGGNNAGFWLTKGHEKFHTDTLQKLAMKLKIKDNDIKDIKDNDVLAIVILDHLGQEGWELVSYSVINQGGLLYETHMLKRKR